MRADAAAWALAYVGAASLLTAITLSRGAEWGHSWGELAGWSEGRRAAVEECVRACGARQVCAPQPCWRIPPAEWGEQRKAGR